MLHCARVVNQMGIERVEGGGAIEVQEALMTAWFLVAALTAAAPEAFVVEPGALIGAGAGASRRAEGGAAVEAGLGQQREGVSHVAYRPVEADSKVEGGAGAGEEAGPEQVSWPR